MRGNRLPHAFLFSGLDGIGKKMVAIGFVKHLLCEHGTACGACRQCIKIDHGTHPDLLTVKREGSEIKIGQSRMISKEVSEHPFEGAKRAIIIDGADAMNAPAANALLKTLEEPPPDNIFFLIASSERDIPLTVRSRCARVAFNPLPPEEVEDYLVRVHEMEKEKARLIARISFGSIGNGIFWADRDNFLLRQKLGETIGTRRKRFLTFSLIAERVAQSEERVFLFLSFLLSLFRDFYVMAHEKESSLLVNSDMKNVIERSDIDLRWLDSSMRKIQETISNMRYNVNKWLLFEDMLFQIMR